MAELVNLQCAEIAFVALLAGTVYSVYSLSGTCYLVCMVLLYVCLKVIKAKSAGKIDPKEKAVFITGCDTGIYIVMLL